MSAACLQKITFSNRILVSLAAARTLVSSSEDLGLQAHRAGQADAEGVAEPVEEMRLLAAQLVPRPREGMQLLRQLLLGLQL